MKIDIYSHTARELSQDLRAYLLENFDGIYVNSYIDECREFAKKFNPDNCLLSIILPNFKEIVKENPEYKIKYMDEPFAAKFEYDEVDKWTSCNVPDMIEEYGEDLIIGELTQKSFDKLYGFKSRVTLTHYRRRLLTIYVESDWLWKLIGLVINTEHIGDRCIRIEWPFSQPFEFGTHIKHLEDLHERFGDRFPIVWVHYKKNVKYAEELISWARSKNKEIIIWAGYGSWKTEAEVYKYISQWVEAYKKNDNL